MTVSRILVLALLILGWFAPQATVLAQVRIKDISHVQSLRDNQLVGYGLVVGLNGTGDSSRNSPFTENSLRAMLERMGVGPGDAAMRTKNAAAVIVTAKLPAFVNPGDQIDVNVASVGDATSLQGGTLVTTPLYGADGEIYAVAQGGLVVSGFAVGGDAATVTQSTPTSARLPNGAIVEKQAPGSLESEQMVVLDLVNPDFNTAVAVADAVNGMTSERYGKRLARERDHRSIAVERPKGPTLARFLAEIGELVVRPDTPARIVVDERTGTVVIGADVRVSPVAVTHGSLTVAVSELPRVVQPEPFSNGVTAVEPNTQLEVQQTGGALNIVQGPTLRDLVDGLNVMGAKPSDVIAILQAIKSAGAIHASIIVQ